MSTSSGSVFGETLQTITNTKLEELSKQRRNFEQSKSKLLGSVSLEKDALKRVCLLIDGLKESFGIQTDSKAKNGRILQVTSSGSHNAQLETDLQNLSRFVEQARFDPSVSGKILGDWEKTLLQYLSVQSTKFEFADLYGKLVTEWLSSKASPDEGEVEMAESFEEVPGAKKLAHRAAWEKDVFEAGEVDENVVRSYLESLFMNGEKENVEAIGNLRVKVKDFQNSLNDPNLFDVFSLRMTIEGLRASDLLSNEKREALADFLSNNVILTELCDILNMRMAALDRWTWGPQVLVEQRRKINGEFSIHFDPDLLQAIFLHYIGVRWSVFFKSTFLELHEHNAWTNSSTEVPKIDRLRRSYFLGDKATRISTSLEQKRKSIHHHRYFAHKLLDSGTQQVKAEEGEEEAEYGEYVAANRTQPQLKGFPGGKHRSRHALMSSEAIQQPAILASGISQGFNEEEGGDEDDQMYRYQHKKPMESKQNLLHLVASEIILNTRIHGEITCIRTTFDSWNQLLPHQTISAVLDFLGVSEKWRSFVERYLQAPLKFTDDPSSEPRLRRRGMPDSHILSDTLGEAVLLCLDFAVNQATGGPDLYRLGDDIWFWSKDYETCVSAWASILKFTSIMGVKLDAKKTGSVRISRQGEKAIDDRIPAGEIRWGFLQLDPKSGRFEIDKKMVDGHIEELRTQLQGKSKSVIDYIQVWNSYAATFFSSNFGKAANCFGREHVDKLLATHRHIQQSIFPDGSIVQNLKQMIEERFSVKDVPDGFLFFPVELGGLDLKSPFVHLLQIRESVEENPYDLIDEYEQKEREDYDIAKSLFAKRDIQSADWKPEDADTFFSFEEFSKYREVFGGFQKASLLKTFKELLKQPYVQHVTLSTSVKQALQQLSHQSNLRGVLADWESMEAYWKWIAQMYGPEMIEMFGGLNVVDSGLLPIVKLASSTASISNLCRHLTNLTNTPVLSNMGFITLIRGFKFSISAFDDFLVANGLPSLGGYQPFPDEDEAIAKLFRDHGIDCEVRVFVPQMEGFSDSHHLYVCCDWVYVVAQKDIDSVFQEPISPEFEKVRDLLGAKSDIRRYIVYNYDRDIRFPEEVNKRYIAPIECGMCDAVFDVWDARMIHRRNEHGIDEDWDPLPEC
ncbi:uncharacterized protein yc1106_01800 [Curvularia clavata]|uniref:C2H2-type domain-containing protein n=1 Tax=Curvularia clavata TaxID=95742 RepID=A0A9Q9DQN9_CURCL|nr:uncharacterized protein yc1106_01800 [Curvularia clavata]